MSAHTPTPWTTYRCQFADEIGEPEQVACGFNGESLDGSYDECHHTLSMADAVFIVRAVNSHDALWTIALRYMSLNELNSEVDRINGLIDKSKRGA